MTKGIATLSLADSVIGVEVEPDVDDDEIKRAAVDDADVFGA